VRIGPDTHGLAGTIKRGEIIVLSVGSRPRSAAIVLDEVLAGLARQPHTCFQSNSGFGTKTPCYQGRARPVATLLSAVAEVACTHRCTHATRIGGISDPDDPHG
jgi:hypothetical protein